MHFRRRPGQVVFQERLLLLDPDFHPFVNESFGAAMNQAVTFSGTPELIHDGTDNAGWTGSTVAGTWDFSDTTDPNDGSNCVSLTSGVSSDEALFSDGTTTDMSGYTAITGQLRLETYNGAQNAILVSFALAGAPVGNSVSLNDYVDTAVLGSYQSFAIAKGDFGLTTQTVDEMNMVLVRNSGPKPTFRFDELQWEQSGTPLSYIADTHLQTRLHVDEVRFAMADNITGVVTNGTMPGLSYNAFMGVSQLGTGVTLTRTKGNETVFSATLRDLGDMLAIGANIENSISDGTNTYLTISLRFSEPAILDGNAGDKFTATVNDDLSGLLLLTASAIGGIEE